LIGLGENAVHSMQRNKPAIAITHGDAHPCIEFDRLGDSAIDDFESFGKKQGHGPSSLRRDPQIQLHVSNAAKMRSIERLFQNIERAVAINLARLHGKVDLSRRPCSAFISAPAWRLQANRRGTIKKISAISATLGLWR
jgi:hypothetical protein